MTGAGTGQRVNLLAGFFCQAQLANILNSTCGLLMWKTQTALPQTVEFSYSSICGKKGLAALRTFAFHNVVDLLAQRSL
jgi:hypothetical protein